MTDPAVGPAALNRMLVLHQKGPSVALTQCQDCPKTQAKSEAAQRDTEPGNHGKTRNHCATEPMRKPRRNRRRVRLHSANEAKDRDGRGE